jgi:hypothetical protein
VHQFGLALISPVLKYIFTSVALYLALNILLNYFSVALIPAIILNAILFVPIFYWLGFFNFSELKQYFNDKLS